MPFCPQCGIDNPANARFCDQCGAALIPVASVAAQRGPLELHPEQVRGKPRQLAIGRDVRAQLVVALALFP